jgi:uncharacterized protein YjiS (DUF1127 family)
VSDWIALIGIWRQRSRDRQMLAAMSIRELQDIGITAREARCEANKPFWWHDTQGHGHLAGKFDDIAKPMGQTATPKLKQQADAE